MTTTDHRQRSGRFGAATPGHRQAPPPMPTPTHDAEGAPPGRRLSAKRRLLWAGVAAAIAAAGYLTGHFTAPGPAASRYLLVTSVPLPAGARLTRADLSTVAVAAADRIPAGALGTAAAASVTGLVTTVAVPQGTFLSRSLLAPSGAVPGPAQALVGLALKPGQLPAGGLTDGQQVLVIALPVSSSGTPLTPVQLATTTVWDEQGPDTSGTTQATVVVPASVAVRLAQYAAQGEVALVQTDQTDQTGAS
jgi:hypothetical protein